MPRKPKSIDLGDAINAYNAGEGIESISRRLGVGWNRLWKDFRLAGVTMRNRSDSMRTRWQGLDKAGREALVGPAHAAAAGRIQAKEEIQRRVESAAYGRKFRNKPFAGRFEEQMLRYLRKLGVKGVWQQPVYGYNLDIGIEPVAVEIHCAPNHPMTDSHQRERTKKLLKGGWSVIHVWINIAHPLLKRAAQDVVAFLEFVKANPAPRGQYRVIWGTGEVAPRPRSNADYIACIPTPVDLQDPISSN